MTDLVSFKITTDNNIYVITYDQHHITTATTQATGLLMSCELYRQHPIQRCLVTTDLCNATQYIATQQGALMTFQSSKILKDV